MSDYLRDLVLRGARLDGRALRPRVRPEWDVRAAFRRIEEIDVLEQRAPFLLALEDQQRTGQRSPAPLAAPRTPERAAESVIRPESPSSSRVRPTATAAPIWAPSTSERAPSQVPAVPEEPFDTGPEEASHAAPSPVRVDPSRSSASAHEARVGSSPAESVERDSSLQVRALDPAPITEEIASAISSRVARALSDQGMPRVPSPVISARSRERLTQAVSALVPGKTVNELRRGPANSLPPSTPRLEVRIERVELVQQLSSPPPPAPARPSARGFAELGALRRHATRRY